MFGTPAALGDSPWRHDSDFMITKRPWANARVNAE